MSDRDKKLRDQCERRVASNEGVNYANARASYGRRVADEIFQELAKHDEKLAFITLAEHQRLIEWKQLDHKRKRGIIKNIIEGTLDDAA